MKKLFSFLLLSLGLLNQLVAQDKFTISGHIKDAASGEGLIGATLLVPALSSGASSNRYGFYSLTLPKGNYTMIVQYLGYQSSEIKLEVSSDMTRDFHLREVQVQMKEVVVTSTPANEHIKSTEMSSVKLGMETLKSIPALLGEVDVIRSIQMLPGVSSVGEGASGFNVRGGGIDQNLILLDEAPVYNSSHLLGFFSVFNPDAVKEVKLLKGGIPSQYGGRLSSLLDVRMKDGNEKRLAFSGGIGTVSSRFAVEAPIIKDKSSFIMAGRRTYGDLFLKVSPDPVLNNNQLYFYDLSAKANYTINAQNRVYLSGYFGKDVFRLGDDMTMDWGNATGTLRWNHLFSPKLFSNLSLIYSDFNYALGIPEGAQAMKWTSNILTQNAKVDFSWFTSPKNILNFGLSSMLYRFKPGKASPAGDGEGFTPIEMAGQQAVESAAYIDHEQQMGEKVLLQYGLRFSTFHILGEQTVYEYIGESGKRKNPVNPKIFGKGEIVKVYTNFEPRFSARYAFGELSSLKLSYNRMTQYIHLISSTTAASPLDVWSPSTIHIKPELADQIAIGYFRNLKEHAFEFSVEAYYKLMSNQIDYVDGADVLLNKHLEGELLFGKGRAYGIEFFLKKNKGRINGWLSYTLSRTERLIEGINNNAYYPAKYDKPHSLIAVGIFELDSRWRLSGNFVYNTGVATTFPNGRFEQGGLVVPVNTDNSRNNYRIPAYHRFDLAATWKGNSRPGRRYESSWTFSIYNLYARRNAYSVYFQPNKEEPHKTEAIRMSVFGTMIPSVTYNFNF